MNLDTHLDPDEREQLAHLAELLVTGLSFVFLGLLVVEYGLTLSPTQSRWVELAGWCIWVVFALDFVVRFAHAEAKGRFLREHWLTAVAVLLPAFRVLRVARAVRAARSLRLARLVTGTNRGARALRQLGGFAGAGYIIALTGLVWILGAAGVTALERGQDGATLKSFPDALWWSATTLIQQGSQNDPATAAGRTLAVLLMIYALAVAGYITAVLAAVLLSRAQTPVPVARGAGAPPVADYIPSAARSEVPEVTGGAPTVSEEYQETGVRGPARP